MADRAASGTLSQARRHLNLCLLVLALVLAGLLFLSLRGDRQRSVSGISPSEIHQITVTRSDESSFTLQRTPSGWYLSAPGVAAVSAHAQADLLAAAAAISRGAHELSQLDEASVGLSPPHVVLQLNGETRLEFGDRAALSGLRYLRVGDTVHLVDDRHYHSVNQSLGDIVDEHLLPAGSEMVALDLGPWHLKWDGSEWLSEGAHPGVSAEQLARAWSSAEAAIVGKLNPQAPTGEPIAITITTAARAEKLELDLIRSPQSNGLYLARRDLGVAYHFPSDRAPPVPHSTPP